MTYNSNTEAFFVEVGIVHQTTTTNDDDEGDQDLEASYDADPDGCLEDIIRA